MYVFALADNGNILAVNHAVSMLFGNDSCCNY